MNLGPGEPDCGPWRVEPFPAFAEPLASARVIATEGRSEPDALRNWDEWEAEEVPFLLDDRPWERADVFVSTAVPHKPETEAVTARPTQETPP